MNVSVDDNTTKENEKFDWIVKGLQEIIGEQQLIQILKERNLKVYWGTAPTGRPHMGYLNPLIKICHFLKADCEVTILLADLHAYLDSMKSTWEQLDYRVQFYQILLKSILEILGAPVDKLKFVRGTDFQLNKQYTLDMYKIMSNITLHDAVKGGAEVVKQDNHPKMSSLLYPGLQALDEQYLDIDAQFGGIDQRKIFMLSEKYLPMINYKKRIHLMNPMISSLNSSEEEKMSSSIIDSKIDFLDTPKKITKKLNKAFCEEGNVKCGLFKFLELVIFPLLELKNKQFIITRKEKWGGNLEFDNYKDIEEMFINKKVHPGDLKKGITNFLIELLDPINKLFSTELMTNLVQKAYPE